MSEIAAHNDLAKNNRGTFTCFVKCASIASTTRAVRFDSAPVSSPNGKIIAANIFGGLHRVYWRAA
jgi:hypothetical protein